MTSFKSRKTKVAIIREELVALTGDAVAALILNQALYWNGILEDMDKETLQKIESYEKLGAENKAEKMKSNLRHGWFFKSAKEMQEEIMISTRATVDRKMKELVENKYLFCRKNPTNKLDRTNHYKVNIPLIQEKLSELGYVLDGYTTPSKKASLNIAQNEQWEKSTFSDDENDIPKSKETLKQPIAQNEQCTAYGEQSTAYDEQCVTHSEQTIPEITTKITTKITNIDSLSLSKLLSLYLESEFFKKREREIKGLKVSDILSRFETLKGTIDEEKFIAVLDYMLLNNDKVLNFTTLFRLCEEKIDFENSKRKFPRTGRDLLPIWFKEILEKEMVAQPLDRQDIFNKNEDLLKQLELPQSETKQQGKGNVIRSKDELWSLYNSKMLIDSKVQFYLSLSNEEQSLLWPELFLSEQNYILEKLQRRNRA